MNRRTRTSSAPALLVVAALLPGLDAGDVAGDQFRVEPGAGSELEQSLIVEVGSPAWTVRSTFTIPVQIHLEVDSLSGVGSLPANQTPPAGGGPFSLPDIYEPLGIFVTVERDDTNVTDLAAGSCYSNAELDSLLIANRDQDPPSDGNWNLWAGFVTCFDVSNPALIVLGSMWRTGAFERDGFAIFEDAFTQLGLGNEYILRATAHELGHALNLYHNDGDDQCSGSSTGTTIMNTLAGLDLAAWGYGWSADAREHMNDHPESSIEPGTATPACSCTATHFCSGC